jgi:hypothetical protein
MTMPSAIVSIFGSKEKIIAVGMEENLANPAFGLKAQDEANSYLTGGLSDFGIPGLFLYPVLLALGLNFLVRVGMSRASEVMLFLFSRAIPSCSRSPGFRSERR